MTDSPHVLATAPLHQHDATPFTSTFGHSDFGTFHYCNSVRMGTYATQGEDVEYLTLDTSVCQDNTSNYTNIRVSGGSR